MHKHTFLLAACWLVVGACMSGEGAPADRSPRQIDNTLIYLEVRSLRAHSLSGGEATAPATLPRRNVEISPQADRYAFARRSGKDREIEIGSLVDPATVTVPGWAPTWSPDGTFLAARVEATGYRICDQGEDQGKGCFTADRVAVYDVSGGAPQDGTTALGAGKWTIHGWIGDAVLGFNHLDESFRLGRPSDTHEEVEELGLDPARVWGFSPAAPVFVLRSDRGALFYDGLEGRTLATVGLGGARLGPGAFSPDGTKIAAVLESGASPTKTSLAVIGYNPRSFEEVPGSSDALGDIVWSDGSDSFAYLRRVEPGRVEAIYCSIELECRSVFEGAGDVKLVALR